MISAPTLSGSPQIPAGWVMPSHHSHCCQLQRVPEETLGMLGKAGIGFSFAFASPSSLG